MYRFLVFAMFFMLNACTTEYVFVDDVKMAEFENDNNESYYIEDNEEQINLTADGRLITANDVFVVGEGSDFVTYQYKNVRVDEISPLASMYCADVAYGGSPYLREVSLYHNGFMRATFDCVNLAI